MLPELSSFFRPLRAARPRRRAARPCRLPWLALLLLLASLPVRAQEAAAAPPDKPILRIETGMHTATINRLGVDAANRYLLTSSDDKTVRVWDAKTGTLLTVLRPPIGAGDEGKIYAAAISPDGRTVACGGWTSPLGQTENIYLFDRATATIRQRVSELPDSVSDLAYSPDGKFLAATLASGGIRLYHTADYSLAAQDKDYSDQSNGAAFGLAGGSLRLVTSCEDGFLRLYDVEGTSGTLHLRAKQKAPGGSRPQGVAISPEGDKVAAGFVDSPKVALLSGDDLSSLAAPNTTGVDFGYLSDVSWSADGRFLYAAGRYGTIDHDVFRTVIRKWAEGGAGAPTDILAADNTIFALQPRQAGGMFFAASSPSWGTVDAQDQVTTLGSPSIADFRINQSGFRLAAGGNAVAFAYQFSGKSPAIFSLLKRKLTPDGDSAGLNAPVTTAAGLNVQGWDSGNKPTLNGKLLKLNPYEQVRSLAIAPDHAHFLLGTEWYLRLFNKDGTQKWQVSAPDVAWDVNISKDGKVGVAAFGDGTIRWYRMTDGQELLDFFPHADRKRWVLWTPSGYYDCSPGGEDLIGWHVNHGRDQAADFFPVSHFRDAYYRPDVISKILATQNEAEALRLANAETGRTDQAADIQKTEPPVVAITSPDDGAKTGSDTVTIAYTLRTPSGEPVTEARALVDGRPVLTESGLSVISDTGVGRTLIVPIPARDCQVSVLAFNKFGASVAATVHIRRSDTVKGTEAVSAAGPEFTIQPKLYVLAVGISQYDDASLHLTYPGKDARDFVSAMQAQKGRLYRDVVVYRDKAMTDKDATREAIEDGLDWLKKQTTSNDVAMIFLSGHGNNDPDGNYFFLPVGFSRDHIGSTRLPWTELVSTVKAIPGKVILFNDSCHSGNMAGGGLKGAAPDNTGLINELTSAENGGVFFAASTGSEYAREDPVWNNGAFTKALVEGIDGLADDHHTGRVTVNMLSLYVAERVKTLTGGTQHPTAEKPPTVRDFPLALDGQN